jgi:FKBP-type peptidyl-prolyl cis-trans isomerase
MNRLLVSASAAALLLAACGGASDEAPESEAPASQSAGTSAAPAPELDGPSLETILAEDNLETRMALLEARGAALQQVMRERFETHISPLQGDMQAIATAMESTQAEMDAANQMDAAPIVAEARACDRGDAAALDFTAPEPGEDMAPGEANAMISQALMLAAEASPCVFDLGTGLRFRIDRAAGENAPVADPGELVEVNYEGNLPNGEVFDSSYERGEPATFPSNGVIQGWVQALAHMRVGEQWTLFIPSDLGYGPSGRGPIGPNEAMIFKVELLGLPNRPDVEPDADDSSDG